MIAGAILSIDTAGEYCSVALQRADGVITEATSAGGSDHFEKMSLLVTQMLEQSGVKISEIQQLKVGLGPGSFTGLRIGISFCKGLAWAWKVPLVGYCSFEALARAVARQGVAGRIAVASDARRDEVFCAEYELDDGGGNGAAHVTCNQSPCICPLSDFATRYIQGPEPTRIYTPMKSFHIFGNPLESVNRTAFGGIFVRGKDAPFSISDVAKLEPNYLRAVAAKTIEERSLGA